MSRSSTPQVLTLELMRAEGDLGSPPRSPGPVLYRVRAPDGGLRECTLTWTPALQQRLMAWSSGRGDAQDGAALRELLLELLQAGGWLDAARPTLEAALEGRCELDLRVDLAGAELALLPWELLPAGQRGVPVGRIPGVVVQLRLCGVQTTPEPPRPEGGRLVLLGARGRDADALRVIWDSLGLDAREAPAWAPGLEPLASGAEALHWVLDDTPLTPQDLQAVARVDPSRTRLVVLSATGHNPGLLALAQALHKLGVEAVLLCRGALPPTALSRFCAAFYGALWGQPTSVGGALRAARAALLAEGLDSALGLVLWGEAAALARPFVFCPYPGLAPYEARHQRFLCGRDQEIGEVQHRLSALAEQRRPRFLVLVGGSGSGKSSLARAGVLPALRRAQPDRVQALMRPGEQPMQALADALELALGELDLPPHGAALVAVLQRHGRPLLLLVDQLEELFTQAKGQQQERFAAFLWQLAQDPQLDVQVLATMRADLVGIAGQVLLDPASGLRLDRVAAGDGELVDHRLPVLPLRGEQLRQAVEGPIAAVGLRLEPGLIELLLRDVEGLPNVLPLLALCMVRLWASRSQGQLLLQRYLAQGGVSGALATHADEALSRLDPRTLRSARTLLVRLVRVGKPGEPADLRRHTPRSALVPASDSQGLDMQSSHMRLLSGVGGRERLEALRSLLPGPWRRRQAPQIAQERPDSPLALFEQAEQALVAARLVVREGEGQDLRLELAHEALLRAWPTLGTWVEAERETLRQLDRAQIAIREWRERGLVLSPPQTVRALSLLDRLPEGSAPQVEALVDASARHAQRRLARKTLGSIGLVALSVLVLVLVVFANVFHKRLEQASDRTRTRMMLAAAAGQDAKLTERVWLLEQVWKKFGQKDLQDREGKLARWETVAMQLLTTGGASYDMSRNFALPEGVTLSRLTWSPSGRAFVFWDPGQSQAWLMAFGDGTSSVQAILTDQSPLRQVVWSPDGQSLWTLGQGGAARRWGEQGGLLQVLELPEDTQALAPGPAGALAVAGPEGAWVYGADGQKSEVFPASQGALCLAWEPQGARIAVGGEDGALRLYSPVGAPMGVWSGTEPLVSLAWGEPGLAYAGRFGSLKVLTQPGEVSSPIVPLRESAGPRSAPLKPGLAWSVSGELAVEDLGVLRIKTGETLWIRSFSPGQGPPSYRPDGILTVGVTMSAIDVEGSPLRRMVLPESREVHAVLVSPSGEGVGACTVEAGLVWWSELGARPQHWVSPIETEGDLDEALTSDQHLSRALDCRWSTSGEQLLVVESTQARSWAPSTDQRALHAWPELGPLRAGSWSPNGRWILGVPADATQGPWVLEALTGASPRPLQGAKPLVLAPQPGPPGRQAPVPPVSWSPDGAQLAILNAGALHLWDLATGQELATIGQGRVRLIPGWGADGLLRVLELRDDGAELQVWQGARRVSAIPLHRVPTRAVWSPDRTRLALWTADGEIFHVDQAGALRSISLSGLRPLVHLSFTPDGHEMVGANGHLLCRGPLQDIEQALCVPLGGTQLSVGQAILVFVAMGQPMGLAWERGEALRARLQALPSNKPTRERLEALLGPAAEQQSLIEALKETWRDLVSGHEP